MHSILRVLYEILLATLSNFSHCTLYISHIYFQRLPNATVEYSLMKK